MTERGNSESNFVSETISKKTFESSPAQEFLKRWCEVNDSIEPKFISREEFNKRENEIILEENSDGKKDLFLPTDLKLWEMIEVVRTIDSDTFKDKDPEFGNRKADKLIELGKTFEKAGLYLNEYLPENEEERGMVEIMADEFLEYGISLQQKNREEKEKIILNNEDKKQLDEWFLGKDVYQKRIDRLGDNPSEEKIEKRRKSLTAAYFKALKKQIYEINGEKVWINKEGLFEKFQNKTGKQIIKAIETPERELNSSIFRRGVENLVKGIDKFNWEEIAIYEKKLYDYLEIPKLKLELEKIRETKNLEKISNKERNIAFTIQMSVCDFTYQEKGGNNPSEMVKTQKINCLGASMLGGGLLDEVGIKYLAADIPGHSLTFLITSDEKIYVQDFTPSKGYESNKEIIDVDIFSKNKSKTEIMKEIIDFSNSPEDKILSFMVDKDKPRLVSLFKPESGLQCQFLHNTGIFLREENKRELMIEFYKRAISINPEYIYAYNSLGNALNDLRRYSEAVEVFKKGIEIYPGYDEPYNGLAFSLCELGKREESLETYKKAIEVNPKNKLPYLGLGHLLDYLGRYNEAIAAYKKLIENSDDEAVIKEAQEKINTIREVNFL